MQPIVVAALATLFALGPALAAQPDAEGPTTTITTQGTTGANGWWTSSTTIILTCAPTPCAASFRVDGAAWAPYTAPFVLSAPGVHLVEARADGDTGSGPTALATIAIDPAPPQTQATVAAPLGDAPWLVAPADLTLACHDDTSGCRDTTYSLDGQPSQSAGGTIRIDSDGAHRLRYRSTDHAGWHEDIRELTIPVDTTPPTVDLTTTCTRAMTDTWCTGEASVTVLAADATSGLQEVTCHVEGLLVPCDALGLTGDGVRTITAEARDAAGHTTSAHHQVGIDTEPPTVTLTFTGPAGADGTYVGPVTVHAMCHDATSGCATLHPEAQPADTWPATTTLDTDGTHTIAVHARDHAGITGPPQHATVTIDTTGPAPSHTLDGPRGDADWFVGATTVSLHCTDAGTGCASLEYRLDDADTTTYQAPFVVASDHASHAIDYLAVDQAGNAAAPETARFGLDATPPEITARQDCDDSGANGWCRGTITSHASATDATSGLHELVCTSGTSPVPCAGHTVAHDGRHTLRMHARDHAGLAADQELPLGRDATAPTITFALTCPRVGLEGWCAAPVTVVPSATDPHAGVDALECRRQGVEAPCDALVASAPGATTFTVMAHDQAGNLGARSTTVHVDTDPPSVIADVTCASGWQQDWCKGAVRVRALIYDDTSGVVETLCLVDGVAVPCTGHDIPADGRHDLVVQARDRAGNTVSFVRAFGVDQTPPEVEWTRPETGCVYIQDEATTCTGTDTDTVAVGPLTLVALGTDDTSGIASVTFQVDGRQRFWTAADHARWTWDGPDPVPARHRVTVQVQDQAGNLVALETWVARVV